jgi:hypothetical protein
MAEILYGKDQSKIDILQNHFSVHFMEEDISFPSKYLNLMMRCFDHKYLYDFALIKHLAKEAGYTGVDRIANSDVPDKKLKSHIMRREAHWQLETETFLLIK